jgi:hypothetical protein
MTVKPDPPPQVEVVLTGGSPSATSGKFQLFAAQTSNNAKRSLGSAQGAPAMPGRHLGRDREITGKPWRDARRHGPGERRGGSFILPPPRNSLQFQNLGLSCCTATERGNPRTFKMHPILASHFVTRPCRMEIRTW